MSNKNKISADKEETVMETPAEVKVTDVENEQPAEEKKETVVKKKPEVLAYIGPTIPGVAVKNTVFCNGIPDALKKEMVKQPVLKGFLVQMKDVPSATAEIRKEGSALNILYRNIKIK